MILFKSCSESLAVKVQTIERGYYRTYTGENYVQSRVKSADNLNFRLSLHRLLKNIESILFYSYFK